MNKLNISIECKLPDDEVDGRLASWSAVWQHVDSVIQLQNGISAKIPGASAQALREFAAAEAECCPSMLIEVNDSDEELGIRITSEKIEMVQAIHSWFSEGDNNGAR